MTNISHVAGFAIDSTHNYGLTINSFKDGNKSQMKLSKMKTPNSFLWE